MKIYIQNSLTLISIRIAYFIDRV